MAIAKSIRFCSAGDVRVTGDESVVELMLGEKVKLMPGTYENIKITTPGHLDIAKTLLARRKKSIKVDLTV